MVKHRIPHSKPYMPPLADYGNYLEGIWHRQWLTNHGPLVQEFEQRMAAYLNVPYTSYLSSGTAGLQCVLRTLPRSGEIITTPYSYVATAGAIHWEGFTPVYADVDPTTLAPTAAQVRACITPRTRGILVTHVYGLPANVDALEAVAHQHGLPIYYDAAHAFGTLYRGDSLAARGRFAVLSLHATKVFHTANGGLVVCHSHEDKALIDAYRNFGHDGPNHFPQPGINAKNSELHAALGLAILPQADALLSTRRAQWQRYKTLLGACAEPHTLSPCSETLHNGAYFPLLHLKEDQAKRIQAALLAAGIEARRYFSPALNTIDHLRGGPCPVAEGLCRTVLCLPLYHDLRREEQEEVAAIVLQHF
jgi:dTDP-4-amino-4,6-dideoxygalactose transaminase